jgi:hypothetical protein
MMSDTVDCVTIVTLRHELGEGSDFDLVAEWPRASVKTQRLSHRGERAPAGPGEDHRQPEWSPRWNSACSRCPACMAAASISWRADGGRAASLDRWR